MTEVKGSTSQAKSCFLRSQSLHQDNDLVGPVLGEIISGENALFDINITQAYSVHRFLINVWILADLRYWISASDPPKYTRVTQQNKIFDLTLLTFIMAILGSIDLKIIFFGFFEPRPDTPQPVNGVRKNPNFFLRSVNPRTAMIKVSNVKSENLFCQVTLKYTLKRKKREKENS